MKIKKFHAFGIPSLTWNLYEGILIKEQMFDMVIRSEIL